LCGSDLSAAPLKACGAEPVVVPYGVSPARAPTHRPRIRISVFGSFEPRKGQDLAALAIAQLDADERAQVELCMFGRALDMHFKSEVERISDAFSEIEIGSALTYERYVEEMAKADVVLVSSRDDTLPLVSLDALAHGKILICGRMTGTSHYIKDGVSGLVFDVGTPEAIAACVRKVIKDADLRKRIQKGALRAFEKNFTMAVFERRLLDFVNFEQGAVETVTAH
jgi:glycosyltransferase involved in cell wall biosynthesis